MDCCEIDFVHAPRRPPKTWKVAVGATAVVAVAVVVSSASAVRITGDAAQGVAVVPCKGVYHAGGAPKAPATLSARVLPEPSGAVDLRFYYYSGAAMLAPKGWRCSGTSGSNAATVTAWAPSSGTHRALRDNKAVQVPNEVLYAAIHTPGNWSLEHACEWFPDAARKYQRRNGLVCDGGDNPTGTTFERPGSGTVRVTLPPGEQGSATSFSGGPNVTVFQIWWAPKAEAAAHAVCALREHRGRTLCTALLADFGARFRASVR